ncbi:mas-related G-protein coupled receptor member X1-like [Nannospalax galili]|uniref:mas-related G-protein coupled receptor member X1-like n=1 Tax=Nannospalax galili TaxID=1026970 RepID=UPI0004ED607E|nr:mas-related G-protein coupled receptor member X1-like [Nannospalax galili]
MNLNNSFQDTAHEPTNETDHPDDDESCSSLLALHFLALIIALIGLAGNAVVLWLLGFRMHWNPISFYILNLAVADFLFLCCHIIHSLLEVISFYELSIENADILSNGSILPYIAGLSTLSAISTERCLAILWPIWYHCHRPINMSVIVCVLIWALSLLMTILDWCYSGFLSHKFSNFNAWKKADIVIVAFLIFLFVVLSGSSLALLVRILCGSRKIPMTRLYVTISLTVLVFVVCGLPLGLHWFLLYWFEDHWIISLCHIDQVTFVLSTVNCCANPVIYFFVGSFRQWKQNRNLQVVLQRALQDTLEEGGHGDSLPWETLPVPESRK